MQKLNKFLRIFFFHDAFLAYCGTKKVCGLGEKNTSPHHYSVLNLPSLQAVLFQDFFSVDIAPLTGYLMV